MKSSMKDEAEGVFHQAKGNVKEFIGKLTDNPKVEAEGVIEQKAGKIQRKIGQIKKVAGK
jgi:uncharacterized protein YjbJ (UPF0337 family)